MYRFHVTVRPAQEFKNQLENTRFAEEGQMYRRPVPVVASVGGKGTGGWRKERKQRFKSRSNATVPVRNDSAPPPLDFPTIRMTTPAGAEHTAKKLGLSSFGLDFALL